MRDTPDFPSNLPNQVIATYERQQKKLLQKQKKLQKQNNDKSRFSGLSSLENMSQYSDNENDTKSHLSVETFDFHNMDRISHSPLYTNTEFSFGASEPVKVNGKRYSKQQPNRNVNQYTLSPLLFKKISDHIGSEAANHITSSLAPVDPHKSAAPPLEWIQQKLRPILAVLLRENPNLQQEFDELQHRSSSDPYSPDYSPPIMNMSISPLDIMRVCRSNHYPHRVLSITTNESYMKKNTFMELKAECLASPAAQSSASDSQTPEYDVSSAYTSSSVSNKINVNDMHNPKNNKSDSQTTAANASTSSLPFINGNFSGKFHMDSGVVIHDSPNITKNVSSDPLTGSSAIPAWVDGKVIMNELKLNSKQDSAFSNVESNLNFPQSIVTNPEFMSLPQQNSSGNPFEDPLIIEKQRLAAVQNLYSTLCANSLSQQQQQHQMILALMMSMNINNKLNLSETNMHNYNTNVNEQSVTGGDGTTNIDESMSANWNNTFPSNSNSSAEILTHKQ